MADLVPLMPDEATGNGFVAKLTQFFALYLVYVFVSGWTFFDYYFREFGIDPRWLDLPLQEVLAKGFTILFTHGYWLWPIYLVMILGPIAVDEIRALHNRLPARITVTAILFGVLIGVYFASRSAGSAEAATDKTTETRLPLITFSRKSDTGTAGAPIKVDYTGQVLAFRNGIYYLHHVVPVNDQYKKTIALSVVRVEDMSEIQIAEH